MIATNIPRGRKRRDLAELSDVGTFLHLIEEDRHRLARELHDETGQILTAVLYKVDLHLKSLPAEFDQAVAETRDIRLSLVDALRDLRRLVYRLYPPVLTENGLVPAIRWLVDQFAAQYRILTTVEVPDECRLPATLDLAVFRIVQEALTNVAKHSQAMHVRVRLNLSRDWVSAEVEDDGLGFDVHATPTKDLPAFGLIGMRERAREFYGDVAIVSARGVGTTVRARLSRKGFAYAQHSGATRRRPRHSPSRAAGLAQSRTRHRSRRRSRRRARRTPTGSSNGS